MGGRVPRSAAGDDTEEEGGAEGGPRVRAIEAAGPVGLEARAALPKLLPVGSERGAGEGAEVLHEQRCGGPGGDWTEQGRAGEVVVAEHG